MKRFWISLIILFVPFIVFSQDARKDLIIALDSSASMFEYHRDLGEKVISPLLQSKLNIGDTVHIVSFSDTARLILSRKVEGRGDIQTIATHILLTYPINPWSDVILALDWLGQYMSNLPANRQKTLVFISDGEHLAPPNSPNGSLDAQAAREKIEQSARELKGNAWEFHYIKSPGDIKTDVAQSLQTPEAGSTTATKADSTTATKADSTTATEGQTREFLDSAVERDIAMDFSQDAPLGGPQGGTQGPDGGIDASDTVIDSLPAQAHQMEVDEANNLKPLIFDELHIEWLKELGTVKYSFKLPLSITNPSARDILLECKDILIENKNILAKPILVKIPSGKKKSAKAKIFLNDSFKTGPQSLKFNAQFLGDLKIISNTDEIHIDLIGSPLKSKEKSSFIIFLLIAGILLALVVAFVILMLFKNSLSSPAKALFQASSFQRSELKDRATAASPPSRQKPEAVATSSGAATSGGAAAAGLAKDSTTAAPWQEVDEDFPVQSHSDRIMLSLFVSDQNTAIGKRNVHLMKPGNKLTIGGGNSDFLIFLVRFPERIAKVHFDGVQCHLTIHKSEFFPDLETTRIENCIGKEIHLQSSKGYKLWFRIDRYEDPLLKLNNFLRSIEQTQS